MPIISRQVGTVSQNILVFIPNATVSTGAGLANIVASTVRITWLRSDQAAVSSWLLTSGTLGTWTGSTFTQVNAASTAGLYQVSLPNGLFASGDQAAAFLMSSTATMAPVPILIDLSTQVLAVSSLVGVSSITTAVGVTTGVVSVSAATIPFGVSSIATPVTASSVTAGVNLSSIVGSAAVTSAAGVLGPFAVSSISIPVGVSTGSVRVTSATIPFGVSSISTPVTVSAGVVSVSAATIPFGISSLTAAALGNFFDTGALFFSTAVVSSVVYEIATHATATISGDVGVSAISIPVTVSAGTVRVSAITIPVGVSSGSVEVTSVLAAAAATIADKLLGRNVSGGADTGRLVKEALYVLRNKVDAGLGIVYATDDTASSWAFSVSTVAGDPIQVIDPA